MILSCRTLCSLDVSFPEVRECIWHVPANDLFTIIKVSHYISLYLDSGCSCHEASLRRSANPTSVLFVLLPPNTSERDGEGERERESSQRLSATACECDGSIFKC